jgi:hypothetical protein
MNWWKKATTDFQYLHNVETTKVLESLLKLNQTLRGRIELLEDRVQSLEKFAIQTQRYFELVEARRQADLDKKGNK